MRIQLSPRFHTEIKHKDVRIQKSFKIAIRKFVKDPLDPSLDNHPLRDKWKGFRSIDITADYRAVYEEVKAVQNRSHTLSQSTYTINCMTKYVAFLRGINVGGKNKVPMLQLKNALDRLTRVG